MPHLKVQPLRKKKKLLWQCNNPPQNPGSQKQSNVQSPPRTEQKVTGSFVTKSGHAST